MKLNFFTEARFIRGADGRVYSPHDVMKYSLFKRYLSVFTEVTIIARVKSDPSFFGTEEDLVEGPSVSICPVTYYIGPIDYLKKRRKIEKDVKKNINRNETYILRVPGQIGTIAYNLLRKKKIGYGVEVVGDPFEVFSKGGVNHPLRIFFKYYETYKLKKIVNGALSALYVTKSTLQKKYRNRIQFSASNVEIQKSNLFLREESSFSRGELKLISIGSLEQMYKGPDILLKALSILKAKKISVSLTWIGDGKHRLEMVDLAENLNVLASFIGFINDKSIIRDLLDQSDLFVLASRTEGLPRAVIEAFSRSLPVIGSNTGGIPELLEDDVLFNSCDYIDLAKKIESFYRKPDLLYIKGRENFQKAKNYTADVLMNERVSFYRSLFKG